MEHDGLVTMEEYRRTNFEPDAEFVDGQIEERPGGEWNHSVLQTKLLMMLSQPEHEGLHRMSAFTRCAGAGAVFAGA